MSLRQELKDYMRVRATGVLTVTSSGDSCSIALLFGHIFHAQCGSVMGEDALRMALSWPNSTWTFNPKESLPMTETITRKLDLASF